MTPHPFRRLSAAASRLLIGLAATGLVIMTAVVAWQVIGRYILSSSPSGRSRRLRC
jgi:TRAP-type C4-dicarboxylate transport system permease small subunit